MTNKYLGRAKKNRNDEFYTTYEDVQREIDNYSEYLSGKVVYCNCDCYKTSNFVKYFRDNFNKLNLKELIATNYSTDNSSYIYIYNGIEESISKLYGDGSYDSGECIEILTKCDVVVTNPPFSLFREYVHTIISNHKDFIVLGNMNTIFTKDFLDLYFEEHIHVGYNNGKHKFYVPDDYTDLETKIDSEGRRYTIIPLIAWLTSFNIKKPYFKQEYTCTYDKDKHPKYDNIDAIDVTYLKDLPSDYMGMMGVPITFLLNNHEDEFDILAISNSSKVTKYNFGNAYINGRKMYKRVLIRRKPTYQ